MRRVLTVSSSLLLAVPALCWDILSNDFDVTVRVPGARFEVVDASGSFIGDKVVVGTSKSPAQSSISTIRVSADGTATWVAQFVPEVGTNAVARFVRSDFLDNIWTVGEQFSTGTVRSRTVVAKYSPEGFLTGSTHLAGGLSETVIAVDRERSYSSISYFLLTSVEVKANRYQAYVTRLDSALQVIQRYALPVVSSERISVGAISDVPAIYPSNYASVVCGISYTDESGVPRQYASRIKHDGTIDWQAHPVLRGDTIQLIAADERANVAMCGTNADAGNRDWAVNMLDPSGQMVFRDVRDFGSGEDDAPSSARFSTSGGLVVTGYGSENGTRKPWCRWYSIYTLSSRERRGDGAGSYLDSVMYRNFTHLLAMNDGVAKLRTQHLKYWGSYDGVAADVPFAPQMIRGDYLGLNTLLLASSGNELRVLQLSQLEAPTSRNCYVSVGKVARSDNGWLYNEDGAVTVAVAERGQPIQFSLNAGFDYTTYSHYKLKWTTSPLAYRMREVIEVLDNAGWRVVRDSVTERGVTRHDIVIPYALQINRSSNRIQLRITYTLAQPIREDYWYAGVDMAWVGVVF